MKYIKIYEYFKYEFEKDEYVKLVGFMKARYDPIDEFLYIKNRNSYREYQLLNPFNDENLGWVNQKYIRHLTPEEKEELKLKLSEQKYNL